MRRVTRKGTFVTMTSKRRKRVKRYVTIIAPADTVKMTASEAKLFIVVFTSILKELKEILKMWVAFYKEGYCITTYMYM